MVPQQLLANALYYS